MFLLFPKMVVAFPYMDKDNFDVFTIVKCIFSYGILFIRIIIRIIYKKEWEQERRLELLAELRVSLLLFTHQLQILHKSLKIMPLKTVLRIISDKFVNRIESNRRIDVKVICVGKKLRIVYKY